MAVQIVAVEPGSIAERLGLAPGDQIVAVDGAAVEDELDFRFKTTEERLELQVRRAGVLEERRVAKGYDESLGVTLEELGKAIIGQSNAFRTTGRYQASMRTTTTRAPRLSESAERTPEHEPETANDPAAEKGLFGNIKSMLKR